MDPRKQPTQEPAAKEDKKEINIKPQQIEMSQSYGWLRQFRIIPEDTHYIEGMKKPSEQQEEVTSLSKYSHPS